MNPLELTAFQLSLSTADEEDALFDWLENSKIGVEPAHLPSGVYRVIDGEMYRIVPGIPDTE